MGVTNLWSIIQPSGEHRTLSSLSGQTIAVDLSIWICESNSVKQMQGVVLKPHLRNLFFRISHLTRVGVKLVFVVDGEPPELKWRTMEARLMQQRMMSDGDDEPVWKKRSQLASLALGIEKPKRQTRARFKTVLNECCKMLDLLGIPHIQAAGEAEAMCAFLNHSRIVDACITDDGDTFLYGANTVYRNFTMNVADPHVECYTAGRVARELLIDRQAFVAMGLFLGCDYLPKGVVGVGKEMFVKLVKALDGENVLSRMRQWPTLRVSELSSVEKQVCKKSLAMDGFPFEKVIEEFVICKDKLPRAPLEMTRPRLGLIQLYLYDKLEWPPEYTAEKVVPLMTLYDMKRITECGLENCGVFMEPVRVVKKRVRQGVNCLEIEWKRPDPTADCDTYTTVEERGMFTQCFPSLVTSWLSLTEASRHNKTGKKNRAKSCTVAEVTTFEVESDLAMSLANLKLSTIKGKEDDGKSKQQEHTLGPKERTSGHRQHSSGHEERFRHTKVLVRSESSCRELNDFAKKLKISKGTGKERCVPEKLCETESSKSRLKPTTEKITPTQRESEDVEDFICTKRMTACGLIDGNQGNISLESNFTDSHVDGYMNNDVLSDFGHEPGVLDNECPFNSGLDGESLRSRLMRKLAEEKSKSENINSDRGNGNIIKGVNHRTIVTGSDDGAHNFVVDVLENCEGSGSESKIIAERDAQIGIGCTKSCDKVHEKTDENLDMFYQSDAKKDGKFGSGYDKIKRGESYRGLTEVIDDESTGFDENLGGCYGLSLSERLTIRKNNRAETLVEDNPLNNNIRKENDCYEQNECDSGSKVMSSNVMSNCDSGSKVMSSDVLSNCDSGSKVMSSNVMSNCDSGSKVMSSDVLSNCDSGSKVMSSNVMSSNVMSNCDSGSKVMSSNVMSNCDSGRKVIYNKSNFDTSLIDVCDYDCLETIDYLSHNNITIDDSFDFRNLEHISTPMSSVIRSSKITNDYNVDGCDWSNSARKIEIERQGICGINSFTVNRENDQFKSEYDCNYSENLDVNFKAVEDYVDVCDFNDENIDDDHDDHDDRHHEQYICTTLYNIKTYVDKCGLYRDDFDKVESASRMCKKIEVINISDSDSDDAETPKELTPFRDITNDDDVGILNLTGEMGSCLIAECGENIHDKSYDLFISMSQSPGIESHSYTNILRSQINENCINNMYADESDLTRACLQTAVKHLDIEDTSNCYGNFEIESSVLELYSSI